MQCGICDVQTVKCCLRQCDVLSILYINSKRLVSLFLIRIDFNRGLWRWWRSFCWFDASNEVENQSKMNKCWLGSCQTSSCQPNGALTTKNSYQRKKNTKIERQKDGKSERWKGGKTGRKRNQIPPITNFIGRPS